MLILSKKNKKIFLNGSRKNILPCRKINDQYVESISNKGFQSLLSISNILKGMGFNSRVRKKRGVANSSYNKKRKSFILQSLLPLNTSAANLYKYSMPKILLNPVAAISKKYRLIVVCFALSSFYQIL